MSTYAKPDDLIELTANGIRLAHPETSFPEPLQPHQVAHLGYLPVEADPEPELRPGEQLQRGPLRLENGRIIASWIVQPAPAPQPSDVDTERDRRISAGFMFQGVRYQSRLPAGNQPGDWDVFSGKALEALIAIMAGAQPGDLRWSDPAADFAWIAADNTRVPMDAQTVIELGKAAAAHRSAHTFAGSDLKALATIPADYTANQWWPEQSAD